MMVVGIQKSLTGIWQEYFANLSFIIIKIPRLLVSEIPYISLDLPQGLYLWLIHFCCKQCRFPLWSTLFLLKTLFHSKYLWIDWTGILFFLNLNNYLLWNPQYVSKRNVGTMVAFFPDTLKQECYFNHTLLHIHIPVCIQIMIFGFASFVVFSYYSF